MVKWLRAVAANGLLAVLTACSGDKISHDPPNEPPTLSVVSTLTMFEDTPSQPVTVRIGDLESGAAALTLTVSSDTPALVPNDAASLAMTGTGGNRNLVITPVGEQSGGLTITLTVSDGEHEVSRTIAVQINPVNDAPTISEIADHEVPLNSPTAPIAIAVSDQETDAAALTLSVLSTNPLLVPNDDTSLALGGSGASRSLVVTPAAGQSGQAVIIVSVSDGELVASSGFRLLVSAPDGTPFISPIADLATAEDTPTAAIAFTVSDIDTAPSALQVSASSSNPSLVPHSVSALKLNGSDAQRSLIVTPAADQSGVATITLNVSDGLKASSQSFELRVTAVNDPPALAPIVDQRTDEGQATAPIALNLSDVDHASDSLSLSADSDRPALVPNDPASLTLSGTGASRSLVITPVAGQSGTATISVTVSDGELSTRREFRLVVSGGVNTAPLTQDLSLNARQGVTLRGTLPGSDAEGDPLSFRIVGNGTLGTVAITDSASGAFEYLADEFGDDTVTFIANDGELDSSLSTLRLSVAGDPLHQHQWHLENLGQTSFSDNPGTLGEDINQLQAIADGLSGKGVVVAVIDSGLEIAHEDLAANVVPGGSHDFVDGDDDPSNSDNRGDQGTSVAGLIAASGWNGIGGRGVAPGASLKGFNLLAVRRSEFVAAKLQSLGGADFSVDVHIFNQSYGSELARDTRINSLVEQQLRQGVSTLRAGRGALYVKSAGDGFERFGSADCDNANARGVSCQNSNMDPENATPFNLVVGALDADGRRSSDSTAGSSIFVSAPGGEQGGDRNYLSGEPAAAYRPALLSTDQSGCDRGYSPVDEPFNAFQLAGHAENPGCNYTSTFHGSEAAAPLVSGAIALMLEANPALSWRDVRHILARTAQQVDVAAPGNVAGGFTYELPWTTNAAGYRFHNWYGFGRVDVDAAVAMARDYGLDLGTFVESAWEKQADIDLVVPDDDPVGILLSYLTPTDLVIEAVQLGVDITHTYVGDLAIELISPAGTRSLLLTHANGFAGNDHLRDMVLLSNAFYGERSAGNWTLRVIDKGGEDIGILRDWSLRFYGHAP